MKEAETYIIDLYKIKGDGEFKCPKCGTEISPDDLSEDTYTIMETQVKEDHLEKVILQCNKCGSNLHLTGFQSLERLDQTCFAHVMTLRTSSKHDCDR